MYGMNPYTYSGSQGARTAGVPGMGPGMMGQMVPQQEMMVAQPMMMGGPAPMGTPRAEETYLENILRMNRGKVATVYTTNENNPQWAAKVFKGRVENAARDHVILSDPESGTRYVILMVNIDYITFDEALRYEPGVYRGQ